MRYIKLDLLTLLISLFLFNACKSPDGVGLDVDPANQINASSTDTLTVKITTVRDDSTQTTAISQHPFGFLDDPVFGKTESNLAMGLSFPADSLTSVNFGSNAILDSAVLVLKYGDEFYGDSVNSTYSINVHKLQEKLSGTYYNNKSWAHESTVIGSKTIHRYALHDSLSIIQVRTGKQDTVVREAPQLRIPLSSSFITSDFLNASSSNFTSNAAFARYFKGLYLTLDKAQSSGKGGIAFFLSDSSSMKIYYRRINGTRVDTSVVSFAMTSPATAANIKHDYTGTAIQTQLNNPAQPFNTVYTQPLGGLRARVSFPYLDNLKKIGTFTINKAELIVSLDGDAPVSLDPAPRLGFYRTDIAEQRQPIPDNDGGQTGTISPGALNDGAYGGFYDPSKKRYVFVVTSYIQELLNGKLTQYNSYLAPIKKDLLRTAGLRTDLLPSATTAARSILGGNAGNYQIKLKITYTKLN